jgi:hypothetical protein
MSITYCNSNKTINFIPRSYEQAQIKKIAEEIGERDLTFLLSTLRDFGFQLIEDAYNCLKEQQKKTKIINKPAYLNKIIQSLKEK